MDEYTRNIVENDLNELTRAQLTETVIYLASLSDDSGQVFTNLLSSLKPELPKPSPVTAASLEQAETLLREIKAGKYPVYANVQEQVPPGSLLHKSVGSSLFESLYDPYGILDAMLKIPGLCMRQPAGRKSLSLLQAWSKVSVPLIYAGRVGNNRKTCGICFLFDQIGRYHLLEESTFLYSYVLFNVSPSRFQTLISSPNGFTEEVIRCFSRCSLYTIDFSTLQGQNYLIALFNVLIQGRSGTRQNQLIRSALPLFTDDGIIRMYRSSRSRALKENISVRNRYQQAAARSH